MFKVRKTLILGIGSTGLEVCEQVAEHLTWQYGDFENVPWVKLLVLETAQPVSPLGQRVLYGGMNTQEYDAYKRSPGTTGAEFDFASWHDGKTLNQIGNPSAGAGNCRMLGRLCLFHRRTYDLLSLRVRSDIDALRKLTTQQVANSLGDGGANIQFVEGEIVVYVVGTLCGGTGSGAAADIGYLLDAWTGREVRKQAIFTLPHPNLTGPTAARYKKNAYYALKELNHYLLGTNAWKQLLPGTQTPHTFSHMPYDICRVVMPSTAKDVHGLNAMIGQYLAASVGAAGTTIAASDVDADGKLVGGSAIGFLPPKFSTMGIASLEYPGEHILRAATDRLLATTYERWSHNAASADRFSQALSLLGGSDFNALLQRLGGTAETTYLELVRQTVRPDAKGKPPRIEEMRQMLSQINGRLVAQPVSSDDVVGSLPVLLQSMEKSNQNFLGTIANNVQNFVEKHLFVPEGGPRFVREILEQYLKRMEEWASTAQMDLPQQESDTRSLRDQMDQYIAQLEAAEKKKSPFWAPRQSTPRWEEVTESVESYIRAEVRTHMMSHLNHREMVTTMMDHYKRTTTRLMKRLKVIEDAFRQLASFHEQEWKERASRTPSANGKVFFDASDSPARGTVAEEYFNLIRSRSYDAEPVTGWSDSEKENAAVRIVIESLAGLVEELRRDEGNSAFDGGDRQQISARERIPIPVREAAEEKARAFFSPLRQRMHIATLASPGDVDNVVEASTPKLAISDSMVSVALPNTGGAVPYTANIALMGTEAGGAVTARQIADISNRVTNRLELHGHEIKNNNDPFRLLLVRDLHGFTLGQMHGVVKAEAGDLGALEQAEECTDFPFWHTRRDVSWIEPLVQPTRMQKVEEDWLFCLLLGHPASEHLEWLPATQGLIDSVGWYRVVEGMFRVAYLDGIGARETDKNLPFSFSAAIGLLLSGDSSLLCKTLSTRSSTFRAKHGVSQLVSSVRQGISRWNVYGVDELNAARADEVMRRAFRRDVQLTREFFDQIIAEADQKGNKTPHEFARLWRNEGDPIPDNRNETYGASGYYCSEKNHFLGRAIDELCEQQFECPKCHNGKQYWP